MLRVGSLRSGSRIGQSLVEFALVVPVFLLVLFAVIVFGLGLFYQQQLTNAAREAARYASVHSATAQCPTVGHLDPTQNIPTSYNRCDTPSSWPGYPPDAVGLTAAAKNATWGINKAAIRLSACWAGYVTPPGGGFTQTPTWTPAPNTYDAPPPGTYTIGTSQVTYSSTYMPCSIGGVLDPQDNSNAIGCPASLSSNDTASSQSDRTGVPVANTVTVYVCFQWSPPLAGFVLIPAQVTQAAVVTEPIERQQ